MNYTEYYNKDNLLTIFDSLVAQALPEKIIGSWKVKEIEYIYADTAISVSQSDYGRFIFTDHTYTVGYNPYMNTRVAFKDLSKPDDNELKRTFQTIVFNSGEYTVENKTIHTISDIAKVPGFEGGHQFYSVEFDKGTLLLTM